MATDSTQLPVPGKEALLSWFSGRGHLVADSLRQLRQADAVVPTMSWSAAELGAHLVTSLDELTKAVRGEPCAYDGSVVGGTIAQVDQQLVDGYPVRNLSTLADQLEAHQARFVAAVEARDGSELVSAVDPQGSINSITSIFVLDYHNHGSQVSLLGPPWSLDVAEVRGAVAATVPAILSHEAASGFKGSFGLHLKGADQLDLAFDDGRYSVGVPLDHVDCHVVADPVAFLRLTAGEFITRSHALLTGKLLAYGRRPWLAFSLLRLLPPMTHGGRRGH